MWDCDSLPPSLSLSFSLSLSLSHGLSKIHTVHQYTVHYYRHIYWEHKDASTCTRMPEREREERERGERERGRKNGGSLELSITCARLGGIRDMCRALDTSCNQAGRIIFTSFPWCEEWDLSEMITLIPRRPAGRVAWSGSGSTFPRHCCVNVHFTTDRIMMCL